MTAKESPTKKVSNRRPHEAWLATTTAIGTRAAESSVTALSAKLDAQGSGATRIAIERALADGVHVASPILPQSAGGQLDAVRQIVDDTIAAARTARLAPEKAWADLARGDAALAAGEFRTAYDWYVAAYQRLLK